MVRPIMIVDDERFIAEFMRQALSFLGVPVVLATTARDAMQTMKSQPIALALLDSSLPDASGIDLCRWLRQIQPDIAIMFVSGYSDREDRLRAYGAGADDYLCKPFSHTELVKRTHDLLQRRPAPATPSMLPTIPLYTLELDRTDQLLRLPDGYTLALTIAETRMLALLLSQPGQIIPLLALTQQLWGTSSPPQMALRALETHLRHLRQTLSGEAVRYCYLDLVRNVGVRLLLLPVPTGHPLVARI